MNVNIACCVPLLSESALSVWCLHAVLAERQPVGPNETGATNTLRRSNLKSRLNFEHWQSSSSGPSPSQTRGNRASSLDRPPGQRGILGGGLRGRVPGRSPPCWRVSCQHAHVDIAKECKNRGLLPRRLRSACVLCVCSKTCATCIRSKSSQSCSSCRRCRWHMHT